LDEVSEAAKQRTQGIDQVTGYSQMESDSDDGTSAEEGAAASEEMNFKAETLRGGAGAAADGGIQ
jgi:hypothetical protein